MDKNLTVGSNGEQSKPQGIKVIVKAFQILDLFTIEEPKLTLNQICEKLEQKKTTVFRILNELCTIGILKKDNLTKQYCLGLLSLKYSALVMHHLELRRLGAKYTESLAKEFGISSAIGLREGREIVIVDIKNFEPTQALSTNMGFRDPAHSTAIGKILLAAESDGEIRRIMDSGESLKKNTDMTITDIEALLSELHECRKNGYAVDDGESVVGLHCLAVPLYDFSNHVIAALNVSNLSKYPMDEFKKIILEPLRLAAAGLSKEMGCLSYFGNLQSFADMKTDM